MAFIKRMWADRENKLLLKIDRIWLLILVAAFISLQTPGLRHLVTDRLHVGANLSGVILAAAGFALYLVEKTITCVIEDRMNGVQK